MDCKAEVLYRKPAWTVRRRLGDKQMVVTSRDGRPLRPAYACPLPILSAISGHRRMDRYMRHRGGASRAPCQHPLR